MSVLSIHIDESGNLNLSNRQNPEYCLTMVFHNQNDDISTEISVLDELFFGHLCSFITDVPPQPNSPPNNVSHVGAVVLTVVH